MRTPYISLSILVFFSAVAPAQERDTSRAGNEQVAEIMKSFAGRGVMADDTPPTAASEAVKQFRVRDGYKIELVAGEPVVSQPLFLSWDSRGRLWVVHYRQYQYPAGLKVIRYDQHLRAVFDRVPDPPPNGTPGADKITVHEDTDGDGIYDVHKEVITGLNITSSVAVGQGGIWVLNPPYLLFYPDADRDDVPDNEPEVHLSGFGLQDTHSVANSLMFGPDGWLYACNGSTTVGDVSSAVTKGVRFQGQCVWRYHPTTKEFEIYAEGGGNTFSLDIDSKGRVFTGTNGGNTRGWYFPQGSYSQKNWGKHGPLTNPYAFGFFPPMKFEGDGRRFPQAFCVYEGGLFPSSDAGSIIAPNALHNLVWSSKRIADGSTYRTIDNENLVESPDRWFRPVYCGVGPDGAVYMADWYDTRLSHVSPIDDWHKESGRVYRVVPEKGDAVYREGDLHHLKSERLIELFSHPNKWVRQRAALELGWRNDPSVVAILEQHIDEQSTLEALWALSIMGELSSSRASRWLASDDPHIRRWVVRLLGDRRESVPGLVELARQEQDVQVRSQLASTAKRLRASVAIPIIGGLVRHDEDASDPHMPLMIWWALESHADSWLEIEKLLENESVWRRPLVRDHLLSRLMQRYASAGERSDLENCGKLLALADDDDSKQQLMTGLNRAFQGLSIPPLPDQLARALADYQSQLGDSGLVLGLRQGSDTGVDKAIKALASSATELGIRIELARVFGEVDQPRVVGTLLKLATGGSIDPALRRVAMRSLGQYNNETIPKSLVSRFGSSISAEHGLRSTACRTLASRPSWAVALLDEVNAWRVRPEHVPPDVIQQLRAYDTPEMVAAVEQAFGKSLSGSAPEKLEKLKQLKAILTRDVGNATAGKEVFAKRCGNCHQLFGEGKKVGPPLDGYERGNLNFWLPAIVDPSLEIREGFQSYLVLTDDGRTITGMIAAQDPKTVTLRNADNQLTVIARDEIERLQAMKTSLMPDDVLKEITDQQLRDLFAYLVQGAKK